MSAPTYIIHQGDCLETMRGMADASVDAIVTDPPYHLTTGKKGGCGQASVNLESPYGRARVGTGFMGMKWDGGNIAQSVEMWAEVLRVLKPGGHLLAFSGSRTYHRMVVAIEDAGFEIRDQIMWLYGSGFPKSRDITSDMSDEEGADWEGWGTALKPAHEPIVVARKLLAKGCTVAANVLEHGTGALNIDACRVPHSEQLSVGAGGLPRHREDEPRGRSGEASAARRYTESGGTNFAATPGPRGGDEAGRWPANLIHDGSAEVTALFPETTSGAMKASTQCAAQDEPGSVVYGTYGGQVASQDIRASSGNAARFFYCAKASRTDRNEGCDELPQKVGGMVSNTSGQHMTRRDDAYQAKPLGNFHPTVKPTDLMAYLVRLVTPPGGTVLDPFTGSGSTGKACVREGFNFIGCELDPAYIAIAQARIEFERKRVYPPPAAGEQLDIFGSAA